MAPPATLDPDGCTLGLQELHPALPPSEACLQLDGLAAHDHESAPLLCTPDQRLQLGHLCFQARLLPAPPRQVYKVDRAAELATSSCLCRRTFL